MANFTSKPETIAQAAAAPVKTFTESVKSADETQKLAAPILSEINHHWLARTKEESSELTTLIQNVVGKSPTDAITIWQDWFSGRVKRASDDGKKLLEDSQTLMSTLMPKH